VEKSPQLEVVEEVEELVEELQWLKVQLQNRKLQYKNPMRIKINQ
jgi:ribosomal protein L29